eukprot:2139160-Amphidinium_carterae.2
MSYEESTISSGSLHAFGKKLYTRKRHAMEGIDIHTLRSACLFPSAVNHVRKNQCSWSTCAHK